MKNCPHIWQFCRDLLKNDSPIIKWINKSQGIFKIVDQDKIASLWGSMKERKNAKKMSYEKMSRGIRYFRNLNLNQLHRTKNYFF